METDLENLVVRLTGDAEELKDMLKEVIDNTRQAAESVKSQAAIMENALQLAGAIGGLATLRDFLGSFAEEEAALITLNAVIKSNGRDVEELTERYSAFATEMERTTVHADETTLALLKQAESFGLTGDAAEKAVLQARAFAAINDSSAEAMIRVTAAMAEGNVERAMMFSRMIPQLRGVKDEAEFLEKFANLAAAGMEAMHKQAETATGRMAQLSNAFSNFKEQLGAIIADVIKPVVEFFIDVAKLLQELPQPLKQALVGIVAISAALLAWSGLKAIVLALGGVLVGALQSVGALIVGHPLLAFAAAVGVVVVTLSRMGAAADDAGRRASEAASEVSRRWSSATATIMASLRELTDPGVRRAAAETELAAAEAALSAARRAEADAYLRERRRALDELEAVRDEIRSGFASDEAIAVFTRDPLATATARIADFTAAVTSADERVRGIRETLEGMRTSTVGADRSTADLVARIREEIATLGMSERDIELRRLRLRGASEAATEAARAWMRMADATRRFVEVRGEFMNFTRGLREEIALIGKTGREANLERLLFGIRGEGFVDEARLEALRPMLRQLDMLEKARGIVEEFKTPTERLTERQAELKEMLDAGVISLDVYTRALNAAKSAVNDLAAAQVNAVRVGSAEALARTQAFRERFAVMAAAVPAVGPTAGARDAAKRSEDILKSIEAILLRMERRGTTTAIAGFAGIAGGG